MFDKVEVLFIEVGSSKKYMLSVIIYLKSMEYFVEMNVVWDVWVF